MSYSPGVHPATGEPSYVVVELKQWSSALPEDGEPLLCRVDSYARPVLNPIEQVRGYCEYLASFNGALASHPEQLAGVIFLHSATEFGVQGLYEVQQDERGRLFTGEHRGEFHRAVLSSASAVPAGEVESGSTGSRSTRYPSEGARLPARVLGVRQWGSRPNS